MTSINRLSRKKRQRGSNLVEAAFILMALLSMILFIVEMGRILLMQQYITERARQTVRTAVVNDWTSDQAKNYLCYASIVAPTGGGAGYLGLLPSQVTYTTLGTSGNDDYRMQVKVSGVPVMTWLPYISGQYTLAPIVATLPVQSQGATN